MQIRNRRNKFHGLPLAEVQLEDRRVPIKTEAEAATHKPLPILRIFEISLFSNNIYVCTLQVMQLFYHVLLGGSSSITRQKRIFAISLFSKNI